MRTDIVIRMKGSEKGQQAMKIAAAIHGVESVKVSGEGRSLLQVVGEGIDSNDLITKLRWKVGHAEIVNLRTLQPGRGYVTTNGDYHSAHAARVHAVYDKYGRYPAASYSPPAADQYYYGQQQPSYKYYPTAPYPATVVLHEKPTGEATCCSIM